jgi:hypothetical protein
MKALRATTYPGFPVLIALAILFMPALSWGQEYKVFHSEEYGFSMKYPATWKKIDNPRGNYYVVFQAPELTDNFRNRIHVAAHKPVKDPLKVFLDELRNGIKDLQSKKAGGATQTPQVKILDEGEFHCEVPGAYYFFIQAYEPKLKLWMDIVIVFYKYQDTLLRVSCLAPASMMEKFHQVFNDVLVSVKFDKSKAAKPPAAPESPVSPAPPREAPQTIQRAPSEVSPQPEVSAPQPGPRVIQPQPAPAPKPPESTTVPQPSTPGAQVKPEEQRAQPRGPRSGPGRGPARQPEHPPTGIVN